MSAATISPEKVSFFELALSADIAKIGDHR